MLIRSLARALVTIAILAFWPPSAPFAADNLYDAPGFNANRETISSMANEHIDPFTGGLTLSHTDATLPGNGGLDLVIQRAFNSKGTCREWTLFPIPQYPFNEWRCTKTGEDNWLGYGWTLHFGALTLPNDLRYRTVPHPDPAIEMSDGSVHTAYHISQTDTTRFITKDYWLLEKVSSTWIMTTTSGARIHFGQRAGGTASSSRYMATRIEDVNGNEINISYKEACSGCPSTSDVIDYVIDSVGRRIDFNSYVMSHGHISEWKLASITGPGINVEYIQEELPPSGSLLTEARPPVGDPWIYTYDPALLDLTSVRSPFGGVMEYLYDFSVLERGQGLPLSFRTVVQKDVYNSWRSMSYPATWTFEYSQGTGQDTTRVTDPCRRITNYRHHGYGEPLPDGSKWMYGLPISKEVVGEEKTTYAWTHSPAVSPCKYHIPYLANFDSGIYIPRLESQAIQREGKTYTTRYDGFDDYGNPGEITETGDKTRRRIVDYWRNESLNIVHGKVLTETISGDLPGSFKTTNAYDALGNLKSKNERGILTSYAYHGNGNLRNLTDARGSVTSFVWTNGRVSRKQNPLYTLARSINEDGTVRSETDGRGFTTNYTYDGNLRPTSIRPPEGNRTDFSYTGDGGRITEKKGAYFTYRYFDGTGRPTGTEDAKGITTEIAYKRCGLRDYTTSSTGDTVYFDPFGRVSKIVHKDNSKIVHAYSSNNVTVTDEAGATTGLSHMAFGSPDEKLLTKVTDALGAVTTYDYNILGSLLKITQGSLTRSFTYNTKNFLVSELHPEKARVSYARDNLGNMTKRTDGAGEVVYTHDALSRLTRMDYGTEYAKFAYDKADNRIGMRNTHGISAYTYDKVNRLTKKEETIRRLTHQTSFVHDGNDNVTKITYPSGRIANLTYDGKNQLTSMSAQDSTWSIPSITYNTTGTAAGLPKSYTYSNGRKTDLAYNARNLASGLYVWADAMPVLVDTRFTYDTRGNMTALTDRRNPLRGQSFTYDGLNRLKGFNGNWGTGSYTYDRFGNRKSATLQADTTTYAHAGNRLVSKLLTTAAGSFKTIYTYNGDGDPTGAGGLVLTHNMLHQLTKTSASTGDTTFSYDGDGARVLKSSGGSPTIYHYDNAGRLLSERNKSGNFLCDYVYLHGKLAVKLDPSGAYFYHNDPAGTPLVITNSSGAEVWRADYKPFGEENKIYKATKSNDQKFTGKKKDDETGLYYFGARYMDATNGRFLNIDPVGPVSPASGAANTKALLDPQRLNPYAYGLNNPYKYLDSDGLDPDTIVMQCHHNWVQPQGSSAAYGALLVGLDYAPLFGDIKGSVEAAAGLYESPGELSSWADAGIAGAGWLGFDFLKSAKSAGRTGKQARLRELANDPKASSADRGWIKNEMRHIETGNRETIRLPGNSRDSKQGGKVLAHERGKRAKDGYGYEHSNLQDTDLHKLEHKYEGY